MKETSNSYLAPDPMMKYARLIPTKYGKITIQSLLICGITIFLYFIVIVSNSFHINSSNFFFAVTAIFLFLVVAEFFLMSFCFVYGSNLKRITTFLKFYTINKPAGHIYEGVQIDERIQGEEKAGQIVTKTFKRRT